MDFSSAITTLNWLSVFAAALSTFFLGGIWYKVFENHWIRANRFSAEDLNSRNMILVFVGAFVMSFLMALNLALFIGPNDVVFGAFAGFMAGFGWVALAIGVISLFENRPLQYILINGGYMATAFTLMGVILGAWK